MDLREFIRRIAWERTLVIISVLTLAYCLHNNRRLIRIMALKASFFLRSMFQSLSSLESAFNSPKSEVFWLCVLAMFLIAVIGIVKLLGGRHE